MRSVVTFFKRALLLTTLAAAGLCPILAKGQTTAAQKPAGQAKAANAKTNQRKKSGPATKAALFKKSIYKIVPFLPFEQIAQLELGKRAKYVRQLRKAIVVAEKIQNISLRAKYSTSAKNDDFAYRSRWFALLTGHYAYAQGVDSVRDHCFYAAHLGEYDQNTEERVPFHCVPEYKCVGSDGPGVLCSITMGIPASDKRACIAMSESQHSTARCYELKDELVRENQAKSEAAWKEAENYFFSRPADPDSFKRQAANTDEAYSHIKQLLDTSYDDTSYAETIKVLAEYKKENLSLPTTEVTDADGNEKTMDLNSVSGGRDENGKKRRFLTNYYLEDLDINHAGEDNDHIQQAVEQKYAKEIEHCTRDLTPDEQKLLDDREREQKFKNQASNSRNHAAELENIRYQLYHNLSASRSELQDDFVSNNRSNSDDADEVNLLNLCKRFDCRHQGLPLTLTPGVPTIMEVMENEECRKTAQHIMGVINGFQKLLPDESYTPSPAVKAESNYEIDPTGCSRNITPEEHQLVNPGARCMICLAEKTMEESPDGLGPGSRNSPGYENKKMYTASTKWFSLLSTMALLCGDSIADSTWVHPNTILTYMKNFGHCSSETYDWPADDQTSASDKAEIESWQRNDHYKDPKAFKDDETAGEHLTSKKRNYFEDIYGISRSDATNLFCDKPTVKHTLPCALTFGVICNTAKDVNPALKSADWAGNARKNMAKFATDNQNAGNSTKRALANCMQKSLETAKALYSSGATCLSSEKLNDLSKKDFGNMLEDIHHGGTQVMFNSGSCYVAKQAEYDYRQAATHTTNPNHDLCYTCAINFVDPSNIKDTGSDFGRPTKLIEDRLKPITGMQDSSKDIWYDGHSLQNTESMSRDQDAENSWTVARFDPSGTTCGGGGSRGGGTVNTDSNDTSR